MKTHKSSSLIARATVAIWMSAPFAAFAQFSTTNGISLGDAAANASKSTTGIWALLNDMALLIGFCLVLLGLWLLYQSKKDEGRTKMSHAVVSIVIGTLMIFIPFVIESTGKTIGGSTNLRQVPTTAIQ